MKLPLRSFRVFAASALCLATLLAVCATPRAAHGADGETMPQAVLQADGIVYRVVDDVWAQTDVYWHKGDYSRIIALIRLCVSADPSFTDAYSDGAWLIWSMGDLPAADAFLKDGTERSPNKAEINYEFGFHLFHTKRYTDALPYLKAASAVPHPDRMSLTTLAHDYRMLGRYDESIKTWQEVIRDYPAFGPALTNLARVEELKRNPPAKPATTP